MQRKQNPRNPKYYSFTVSRRSFVDQGKLNAIDRPLSKPPSCLPSRSDNQSPSLPIPNKGPLDMKLKRITKRAFDISISSILIIFCLSWLVLLFTILIRLAGGRTVFVYQKTRKRYDGYFKCIKFAPLTEKKITMGANGHLERKMSALGEIFKKYHLEGFPQIFNVFLGNMSIIGPIPYSENDALKYEMQLSGFSRRYAVKPGIISMDLFQGNPDSLKNMKHMKERAKLEFYYVNHWSAGLDWKILIRSLQKMAGLRLNCSPIYPWESI
jgi:putative colanic acid biosynthesis UDP-glucose lipid carrier transferase